MTGPLPTGREGQAAAAGLLLLVLLLGWFGVVQPAWSWQDDRAVRLLEREALARQMALVLQDLPVLEREAGLLARDANAPAAQRPTEPQPYAVAAAELQQTIGDIAAQNGITLSSTQALPPLDVGGLQHIRLHVALSAPWPKLIRVLQAIRSMTPRLLVGDLQVHAGQMLTSVETPPMDASWTVIGAHEAPAGQVRGAGQAPR